MTGEAEKRLHGDDGETAAMTVAQALARGRQAGVDRLDAQLLLARVLDRPRTWLLAHDDAPLDAAAAGCFASDLARRAGGEPLAYIVGEKEFHGLTLQLDHRVLVPRPETELLVDWAIQLLERQPSSADSPLAGRNPCVLDLGTGSGAIALAVKKAHRAAEVLATDASADALEVARANAIRLELGVRFAVGSWWQPVGEACFDLILSNPPYIAAADHHLHALRHEPPQALTPGGDGLDALRAIVVGASAHLRPGGWLLLEHGHDQARAVQGLLGLHGFLDVQTRRDIAGCPRCTGGRSPWPLE